jgi:hypothetical protein
MILRVSTALVNHVREESPPSCTIWGENAAMKKRETSTFSYSSLALCVIRLDAEGGT